MSNYDSQNAKFQEKVVILNRLYKDYALPLSLYTRLKQSLRYKYNKDIEDLNEFVDELPQNLKIEVSLFIHEQTYNRILFFKGRSDAFIAWICPLLRPQLVMADQQVFHQGQDVSSIYFLRAGNAGFVLSPKYCSIKFIDFPEGCVFGVIDIVGSLMSIDQEGFDYESALENWVQHKDKLKRQFSVHTQQECELLSLSIQDLYCMRSEFLEAYEALMNNSFFRLDRALRLKMQAMKYCDKFMFKDKAKALEEDKIDANQNEGDACQRRGIRRSFTKGYKAANIRKKFVFTAVDLREVDD